MKIWIKEFFSIVFLVLYCSVVIFFIVLIVLFGTAVFVFLNSGGFPFGWGDINKSIHAGWSIGVPGGFGIWLMSMFNRTKDEAESDED